MVKLMARGFAEEYWAWLIKGAGTCSRAEQGPKGHSERTKKQRRSIQEGREKTLQ